MFRTCFVVTALTTFAVASPAWAQAKAVPANAASAGIARLYEDLDYMFALAKEQKALEDLKSTLDVYFKGVDPKGSPAFQLYVRKGEFNLVLHTPIENAKKFRDNIRTLGIKSSLLRPGEYQLKGLFPGFLKEAAGISTIAEERTDAVPVAGGLAAFRAKLEKKDYDFVASIINDASQIKERKDAIEQLRKEVMPGLKKLKEETDAELELRKLTIDQQLTELQQIYGEAEVIYSFTDLVPAKKTFVSSTDLTALPDTDLAKAINELAKEPSYFANIPKSDKEPLSGSLNLKLDTMRQTHLKNFLTQARPLIQKKIKETETDSAKTRDYKSISTDIVFDVIEDGNKAGVLDSFINVHANASGLHTMIGGTKANGAVVKAGLMKLKDAAHVELASGMIGDVELHKVTIPADMTELHKIYGKDLVLIIGTSPNAVWYTMGENAEAKLKEAIEAVGKPAPASDNIVARLHGKAALWYELFDANRTKHKKGDAADRKKALAALQAGDDIFEFKMEKIEGKLNSTLILHEGVLRYFATVAAKVIKESLAN